MRQAKIIIIVIKVNVKRITITQCKLLKWKCTIYASGWKAKHHQH